MISSKDLEKQILKQTILVNKLVFLAKESYKNRQDDMLERQQERHQAEAILEALENVLGKVKEIENLHN
ncbi:MAG: hypothetical protein ACR2M9_00820 [Cyanophyceae cyanobacterium]